jgi:hypothetical protein
MGGMGRHTHAVEMGAEGNIPDYRRIEVSYVHR